MKTKNKFRIKYIICFTVAIIAGLLSRSDFVDFPQYIDDHLGILFGPGWYILCLRYSGPLVVGSGKCLLRYAFLFR